MTVYIAGMHRSNSSILSLMLRACGVDLGPPSEDFRPHADDNPDGYGEHVPTVRINDAVLKALGGAWNAPPEPPADWENDRRLRSARKKAKKVLERRAPRGLWGWKDPRNCLTLPFWRTLVPVDRVIIPLRHPLESAESLERARGIPLAEGLRLWAIYNSRIMESSSPAERLICHVDLLCRDPDACLSRITGFLGLPVDAVITASARRLFRNDRRRHSYAVGFTDDPRLSRSLIELYERQCVEAGVARSADRPQLAGSSHG